VTVWIALSDATAETSCLYFLPKDTPDKGDDDIDIDDNIDDDDDDHGDLDDDLDDVGNDVNTFITINIFYGWVGYYGPGDQIYPLSPLDYDKITSQPCCAGSILIFSHRVIHWGSIPQPNYPTRVAMSFAYASSLFELGPFFNENMLPYPPLSLRIGLRAGQSIAYHNQQPLNKAQLALDNRIFSSVRNYFNESYVNRIIGDSQWAKFLMKQQ
jgi:hypothetical protein